MQYSDEQVADIEAKAATADTIDEASTIHFGYRSEIGAEYDNKGKLKPLGRWLGVTPAAKKMSKRLMRHAQRTLVTPIIEEGEVNSAKGARVSRLKRHATIKQHNRDARQREKDLSLGVTPEQLKARLKHVAALKAQNIEITAANGEAWETWQAERFVSGEIVPAPMAKPLKVIPVAVTDFPRTQGGPIETYFGRVQLGGYLGIELRAIRAEKGVGSAAAREYHQELNAVLNGFDLG